jgi:hypothetical protein
MSCPVAKACLAGCALLGVTLVRDDTGQVLNTVMKTLATR